MKIGVTTSSNINLYAGILINRLKSEHCLPVSILHAERISPRNYFIKHIKNVFYKAGLTHVVDRLRRMDSRVSGKNYLEEFAKANNISDINSRLTEICKRENIEYIKSDSINSSYMVDHIREKEIDILINAGGGIFRNSIINAPRIGILNAHMGYLPKFRGFNVLEWSLFYEETVGVTLHFIERGIDMGDILMFKKISVEKGDTILSLRKKSGVINVQLMIECIKSLKRGSINRIKQIPEDGKQYFVMHNRLKEIAEFTLQNYFL